MSLCGSIISKVRLPVHVTVNSGVVASYVAILARRMHGIVGRA